MDKKYFTVTGLNFCHGCSFIVRGDKVKLVKEPDNKYDREAIRVEMEGLGKIGYVANSVSTVIGESLSAGRLYDRIGDEAEGTVRYVFDDAVVCEI